MSDNKRSRKSFEGELLTKDTPISENDKVNNNSNILQMNNLFIYIFRQFLNILLIN